MKVDFGVLLGKMLVEVKRSELYGNDMLKFKCSDGSRYRMYHYQDCCEHVGIHDICGDLQALIGSHIVQAEESKSDTEDYEWTFYRLATATAQVVISWTGDSSSYYSIDVDFELLDGTYDEKDQRITIEEV